MDGRAFDGRYVEDQPKYRKLVAVFPTTFFSRMGKNRSFGEKPRKASFYDGKTDLKAFGVVDTDEAPVAPSEPKEEVWPGEMVAICRFFTLNWVLIVIVCLPDLQLNSRKAYLHNAGVWCWLTGTVKCARARARGAFFVMIWYDLLISCRDQFCSHIFHHFPIFTQRFFTRRPFSQRHPLRRSNRWLRDQTQLGVEMLTMIQHAPTAGWWFLYVFFNQIMFVLSVLSIKLSTYFIFAVYYFFQLSNLDDGLIRFVFVIFHAIIFGR